jgi:hypothetical protein
MRVSNSNIHLQILSVNARPHLHAFRLEIAVNGYPNLSSSARSVDRWFDTTAFVANYDSSGNLLPGNARKEHFPWTALYQL